MTDHQQPNHEPAPKTTRKRRDPAAPPTGKYPKQVVLMVSTEVNDLIEQVAAREELKKTEVLRTFLHAGIRRAGYRNIITADKREAPLSNVAPNPKADPDA